MRIAEEMCYRYRIWKEEEARPDKTEDRMEGGEEDITPGYITFHVQGWWGGEEGGSRETLVHSNWHIPLSTCRNLLQYVCNNTVVAKSLLSHVIFTLIYEHLYNHFFISILSLLTFSEMQIDIT